MNLELDNLHNREDVSCFVTEYLQMKKARKPDETSTQPPKIQQHLLAPIENVTSFRTIIVALIIILNCHVTAVIQSYTDKGLPIYFPTMLGLRKKFPLQSLQNQAIEQLCDGSAKAIKPKPVCQE